jgi:DNA-binding MarR family transcriptional regulator
LHGFGRHLLAIDDPTMDLPIRQLKVCFALLRRSRSMSEIGREIGMSPSAVTQISDRLERRGLVERLLPDGDRRVRRLQLTAKGLRVMRRHEEKQLRRIAGALDRLTEKELDQLMSGLEILTRSCSRGTNGAS